jgi:hypothetical protein
LPKRSNARTRTSTLTFRNLVRDCAQEPQLIASFNRAYGAKLEAPIEALLDDRWPLQVSAEEEMQIGCFILFVHENIWRRFRRAQVRIGRALGALKPTLRPS